MDAGGRRWMNESRIQSIQTNPLIAFECVVVLPPSVLVFVCCGYQSTGEVISYYQVVVASTTDKMVSHKHIVVAATTGEMVSCISMGCQPPSTVWGAGRTFMRS